MKKSVSFLALLVAAVLLGSALSFAQEIEFPETEQIRVLGRCLTGTDGLYLSWTNSGVEFVFEGTQATASLGLSSPEDEPALMGVFVDDEEEASELLIVDSQEQSLTLAQDLEAGEHTLRLLKLSEARYGTVVLKSLRTDGESLLPTEPRERLIEFIGDSITCGFGTLAEEKDDPFQVTQEDGSLAYAYLLASAFEADFRFICCSGIGVFSNNTGDRAHVMPAIYPYVQYFVQQQEQPPVAKDLLWTDTPHQEADLVVLHLGTNDEAVLGLEDEENLTQFQNAYAAFLKQVRAVNPEAKILVTYGAMRLGLAPWIEQAVETYRNQTGDEEIATFMYDFLAQKEIGGLTAGHPSAFIHSQMADALWEPVCELTGWD